MNVLYIDYEKLHKSERKRLLFLKHLVNLSNRDSKFVRFSDLGLIGTDLSDFIDLLQNNYNQFFAFDDNGLKIEEIDGKILENLDLMVSDLNYVNTKINPELSITAITENLKQSQNIDFEELDYFFDTFLVILFRNWVFKKLNLSILPNPENDVELYKDIFDNFSEDLLKDIFDINYLFQEVDVNKFDGGELEVLKSIVKDIKYKYPNTFWTDLWIKLIKKLNEKEVLDGKKLEINDKSVLLIAKESCFNNSGNPIISRLIDGKTVLFNNRVYLSAEIKINDMVLCELSDVNRRFIIVNPIKILDKKEAIYLLKEGIIHGQPKEEFYDLIK